MKAFKSIKQIAKNIKNQGVKLGKIAQAKCVDIWHIGGNVADIVGFGESERNANARVRAELADEMRYDIGVYWSKHFSQSLAVFNTWELDEWTNYIEKAPLSDPNSINMIIAALLKSDNFSKSNFYELVKVCSKFSGEARNKTIALARKGNKVWELNAEQLESAIGKTGKEPDKKSNPKKSDNESKSEAAQGETERELSATLEKKNAEIDKLRARIKELEAQVAEYEKSRVLQLASKVTA